MARPQKQTVDYFPHYSNASSGKTLYILESKFGNDGYSFWFKLLEILASSQGHFYDARNPVAWEFLLAKTHVQDDIAQKIMALLVDLEAIDKELWNERIIWIQNLVDNITDAYRNRITDIPLKPSLNGTKPLYLEVSDVGNEVSDVGNPQTKLKDNKLKDIIIIPEWIDKEIWGAFLEMRKSKKAASTQYALSLIIKELENFKASGDDPNEILKKSITNSWKGVFPLKGGQDGTHQGNPRKIRPRQTYTRPENY